MYVVVSPFFKTFDDIGLIYKIPDFLLGKINKGQIVTIPFKSSIEYGVVLRIQDTINADFDESKIKSLISIHNPFIFLSKYRLELISWIASYYFSPIHNSHNLFFPKNLAEKIKKDKVNLSKIKEYSYIFNHNITLSKAQIQAYSEIVKSKNNKILFYGLTGSGKTEIYIKLIQDCLQKRKQALFLIPEIILTNQLSEKIINVFGNDVLIINSTVTAATKTKYWLDINSGNAKIIIGTRSALFYPFNNLGLIIMDEEHDNSYISDSSPRYNTVEVANKITELNGNQLILGSGTPSIKSMYKGIKGKYKVINLLEKYS
ncbi:MAG: DEAD/DEAH box helicase family protein [Candidatus Gracilibacteria bacterium]